MFYNSLVPDPFLGSRPCDNECLETNEAKTVTDYANPKTQQIQDRPKDEGERVIKVDLIEEGRRIQPIFISAIQLNRSFN